MRLQSLKQSLSLNKAALIIGAMLALASFAGAQTNPCTGTPQPAHCNIVTVVPAPSQPAGVVVAKWNLYKAATAGGYTKGSPFATNTNPATLTFQDSTVISGQVNHYALTAVSSQGQESALSNDLVATTPTDTPNAPTVTVTSF